MNGTGTVHELTVPPGTYFLGDPGYAMPDEDWQAQCCTSEVFPDVLGDDPEGTPETIVRGHRVIGFSVSADGMYHDRVLATSLYDDSAAELHEDASARLRKHLALPGLLDLAPVLARCLA